MKFPLTTGKVPQGVEPCSIEELVSLLASLSSVEVPDEFLSKVHVGPNTPSRDDTDKVWIVIGEDGKPVGIRKFFRDEWKVVYPEFPVQQIHTYTGDSASIKEPFFVCDGTNGTTDLRSLFKPVSGGYAIPVSGPITGTVLLGYMQYLGYQ